MIKDGHAVRRPETTKQIPFPCKCGNVNRSKPFCHAFRPRKIGEKLISVDGDETLNKSKPLFAKKHNVFFFPADDEVGGAVNAQERTGRVTRSLVPSSSRLVQGGCFGERAVRCEEPWPTSFHMARFAQKGPRPRSGGSWVSHEGLRSLPWSVGAWLRPVPRGRCGSGTAPACFRQSGRSREFETSRSFEAR